MSLSKLKMLAVTFAVTGTMLSGASLYAYQGIGPNPQAAKVEYPPQRKAATTPTPSAAAPPASNPAAQPHSTAPEAGGAGGAIQGGMMGGEAGGGMGGGFDGPSPEELRIKIAQLAPMLAARDKSPKTKDILVKLEEPIALQFSQDTPLEDALKFIKSATQDSKGHGIPIYVDPAGLADSDKAMTSTIILDLKGVPLKTTLRLLLKQLNLAFCVRDGVLIISSVEGIYQELLEAKSENPE